MTLTPAFLDELRARTHLSSLVAKTVKLQRAGREMRGCCPFHNEKTPSFYVNDDKGFYHCFGCSAHGDAIRWMTDQRGLPFIDAVKDLAQAAGLEMPAPDPKAAERQERAKGLHEALQAAADWFVAQLSGLDGAEARALLKRRGVTDETARAFGFGFAPDARGKLRTAFRDFGDPLLIEAGLLIQVDGKEPYDRFRGRLMIPIRDPRGRVIAFGGRVIGEGEPKYLNSPDTPLFDKGRTLFNLDRAAPASREKARVVVVEGYMDVVALAQVGVAEAVAPLGTALTEAQMERLWRLADVPVLCLDGDTAGQKAALRAARRALPLLQPGKSLSFATLPAGQDPDDLARSGGAAALDAVLRKTEPLVERLWTAERDAAPLDTPEERAGLRQRLTELAETVAHTGVRAEYLADFRRRFDAQFATPRRAFTPREPRPKGGWKPPIAPLTPDAKQVGAGGGIDRVLVKAVLAGLIRHPAEIAHHLEALATLRLGGGPHERLFTAVVDAGADEPDLDRATLHSRLTQHGLAAEADTLVRADAMPYSFCRASGDPEQAAADLDEAIAIMVAAPEIDAALAEATAAMRDRFTEAAFARQVALVHEQRALENRLANLCQAHEDARAAALEEH